MSLIIFFTFWVITSNYINSLLYLFPTTLQLLNPTDSITTQIFISSIMASLGLFANLTINSYLNNETGFFNLSNINILIIILSINPIFWMNMNLIEHFSDLVHSPRSIPQFSIISFINFNILLLILLLVLLGVNLQMNHGNTSITVLTIIFLPNLHSIIIILPVIVLLEIDLLTYNINNENNN